MERSRPRRRPSRATAGSSPSSSSTRKIAVNAIRAGVTDTPALRKIPGNAEMIQRCLEIHPAARLTTPGDVAKVIVALSQPDTVWLSGNVLGVDGTEDLIG